MLATLVTNLLSALRGVRREEGQTMVEYGLILALVSVVAIGTLILIGPEIVDTFQSVVDALS